MSVKRNTNSPIATTERDQLIWSQCEVIVLDLHIIRVYHQGTLMIDVKHLGPSGLHLCI
jgi:hypothetical protein